MSPSLRARLPAATVLLLTLTYLLLELPFAAHLLDIVGTTSDPDTIHNTEIVGRLISGLAAALLFWGLVLIPRLPRLGLLLTVLYCAVSGVVITAGVYVGQSRLVEWLVDSSSAEKRQTAFGVMMVTTQIQKGQADIRELPLDGARLGTPEGKTFIAILPALAASQKDIRERLKPSARIVIGNAVVRQVGSPSAFFNRAYVQALRKLHQQYLEYRNGVDSLNRGLDSVDREADQGYARFKQRMAAKRFRGPPPARYRPRVRQDVRNEGVPVPESWDGWSRGPFIKAATDKGYADARRRFRDSTIKAAGVELPPDIARFEDFLGHPSVQGGWRKRIEIDRNVGLRLGMTEAEVEQQIYRPLIDEKVERQIARLQADVQDFAPGGRFHDDGQRAIRGLIVPPIALAFSLIGAFTHLVKSLVTIALVARPQLSGILQLVLAAVGLSASSLTVLVPNTFTQSPAYLRMMAAARESMGVTPALLLRWVVHTQPLLYPVNDALRRGTQSFLSPYDAPLVHWLERLDPPPGNQPQPRTAQPIPGLRVWPAVAPAARQVAPSNPVAAEPPPVAAGLGPLRANGCPAQMRIDAHRGHRDYPENSLEAVVASFREGADAVEIDAQRLRDGTWVLHHDLTLGRVVNGAGTVGKLSSAQWSSLSMKDRNGRATDIVPPTLDAVVAASKTYFARGQRLNVEFKGYYSCGQIEAAVGGMLAAGASASSLTLTSVDAAAVQCMNRFPEAYRARILLDPRAASNGSLAQRAASQLSALTSVPQIAAFAARHPAPVGLHVSALMLGDDPGLLTRVHDRGVKLFVYATRGQDSETIAALGKGLRASGRLPDGVVIDGPLGQFCSDLKLATR